MRVAIVLDGSISVAVKVSCALSRRVARSAMSSSSSMVAGVAGVAANAAVASTSMASPSDISVVVDLYLCYDVQ